MRKKLLITITILGLLAVYAEDKAPITLEKVVKEKVFAEKSISGLRSMKSGESYTSFTAKHIIKYSYQSGDALDTLFSLAMIDKEIDRIDGYEFSDNETKLLIYTNKERIYRHSFYAEYYIWDLQKKQLQHLSKKENLRIASLSPNGDLAAFVFQNNLYIKNLVTGKEIQITRDGQKNKIQNGTPDWVYEEEFGFNKAYQWSPDSKHIAFIKFDESQVKTFNMTLFQGSHPTRDDNRLYPENYTFKYPKAGETNSIVSVHTYNLSTNKIITMDIGNDEDQYIPRIKWMKNSNQVAIMRLNRLQNHLDILLADPSDGKSNVIYEDIESEYVEDRTFDSFTWLSDNDHFVIMNEKRDHMHLYLHSIQSGLVNPITKGNYTVKDYFGVDEQTGLVYFSAFDGSPLDVSLYSVNLDGKNLIKLSSSSGRNRADFSNNFNYFIKTFSNRNTPKTITLHNKSGDLIRTLEDNQPVLDSLASYQFSKKEFIKFKTSQGIKLNAYFIKPVNFDKNKQYPVLIYQYSGPGSQSVTNSWSCNWYQYLISQGYIVMAVDTRGTGGRGEKFKKMTYLQMGKYETLDLIETAKYLQTLPFVDADRIGIWGWSYGGFTTLLAMEKGDGIFKAGVAVAPVTNWRYYDSIYTERFMRTPQENPEGYDTNSPLFFADSLQGKLLICHGSADDNVHMQNTMEYVDKLIQADKQFDMMIYPNRNHSIYGGNTRYHLMRKIADFLLENL